MFKIILLHLFLFLTFSLSQTTQYDHKHIVILPKDWQPYYKLDENGKPTGFAIELIEYVAKDIGLEYEYKIVDTWVDLWKPFESGEVHIVPDLGISEKRKDFSLFSIPTNTFDIYLFKRFNSHHIESIEDLKGKLVGVVHRNIGQKVMDKYPEIKKKVFENHFEAIRALLSGQIDAFAYPKPLMHHTLLDLNIHDKIMYFGDPLLEIKRAIGISVHHQALLEPINKSLEKFLKTHKYQQLYIKYFGQAKKIELTKEEVITIIAFSLTLIVIIAGLIFRNRTLLTQKQLENELFIRTEDLKKSNDYLELVFNLNPNILFTTSGVKLIRANSKFLDFVEFDTTNEFLKSYECICDFFIRRDGYIHKYPENGTLWIDYILHHKDIIHKAIIIKNEQEYIFEINIQILPNEEYLILLHEISILEQTKIALERSNEDLQQFAYIA